MIHFCQPDPEKEYAMKVSKFGGSSVADADQIKKVLGIVRADPTRHYVVVSAPGARKRAEGDPQDTKITDLFYEWHRHRKLQLS